VDQTPARVVIGMDPHKRSVTIEVMHADERIVGSGRFGTDRDGYRDMVTVARQWPARVWAIEGCNGIGRHVALRLLAEGEEAIDVPPKLSARVRAFATGQGRKTDATDAHSIALVGTRMSGLRPVVNDEQLAVLRVLVDRRRVLREDHTSKKAANKELAEVLTSTGTSLTALHGIGPSGAARLLVEVGDITRFPDHNHFASWTGTAPIDASSGDHVRHRLSRGGNRQNQPGPAHHGHRPTTQTHRRPRLLRPHRCPRQDLQRSHALPQMTAVRHRLPHHAQRRRPRHDDEPGRATGQRL
jgi:transposase